MERDKEQRGLAHRFSKERDKEQDGLGHIWEQDQDACLPAYRPLENKTERQTVSSARREQGPRALLTKRSPSREQDREINGLIDGLATRTPSAAHQTIESAAESEIGPTLAEPGE